MPVSTDHPDKPELSSTELLRQAREAFAPPKLDTTVDTSVDGPSLQDLLSTPLSSESLLPQRAVDHWAGAASAEARREALAALKLDAAVEGPTIEELLSAPLSSVPTKSLPLLFLNFLSVHLFSNSFRPKPHWPVYSSKILVFDYNFLPISD